MGKRGQQPIERPADFKSIYIAAKNKKITDLEIAKVLLISVDTLKRWKKEEGFTAGQFFGNRNANRKGMKYLKGVADLHGVCNEQKRA